MVDQAKLAIVLSDFARTLTSEFPIQGILDHLVERIVEVLPVTSAGVTLISPGRAPEYIAASNDEALKYEQLQTSMGEGPCLLAYESGEAVSVGDLANDTRFPRFGPPAVEAGLAATFTFPLGHGGTRLGALDLYRETPGLLDPDDLVAAQTLADVAAAYLFNAQARDRERAATDLFQHSSLHDPLTGLPNRLLLQERIEHAARRATRSRTNAAILFADLDRFKQVNDLHGHQVGDDLLVAVAHRLSALLRPGDTLARLSGDEFVFLCEDLRDVADVEGLAKRIDAAFEQPFLLGGTSLLVAASVGMAFSGLGANISEHLVVEADKAMYQAKRNGGGTHQIIDLRKATETTERNSMEHDLRHAFAARELKLAYQPIVRTADGLVTGVEALLRWTHPTAGPIPPLTMIQIAEESELINQIGLWVLEQACTDRSLWLGSNPTCPLELAVNVSSRQLGQPGFRYALGEIIERCAMDPAALILELTENLAIDEGEEIAEILAQIKELGVRLAMDDFGTGYSSLRYLQKLPIDIVKIDQGFIFDIGRVATGHAVVTAVAGLAQLLGLSVTAEGVETQGQRDAIHAIGCDASQGYYYARPMSSEDILGLLVGRTAGLHLPESAEEELVTA